MNPETDGCDTPVRRHNLGRGFAFGQVVGCGDVGGRTEGCWRVLQKLQQLKQGSRIVDEFI